MAGSRAVRSPWCSKGMQVNVLHLPEWSHYEEVYHEYE